MCGWMQLESRCDHVSISWLSKVCNWSWDVLMARGLNEIIGATRAIEGGAYWIALVVSWMQTLGSQPVMPKISPITGTRCLPKP
jgi:hypothetical protein